MIHAAKLVHDQEHLVDDIERNTDDTAEYAAEGQAELLKLLKFVSGDRALIVRMLVAVAVLGMVVVYFWTR